ncbi:MAG: ABC transporter ATP-binding protein [Phototrophicaceae bacterium]
MSEHSFQEEEFDTSLNGGTLLRILGLTRPHWKSVAGFVVAIGAVAILEAYLNFLNAQLIDDAILAGNVDRLWQIATIYGVMWIGFAFLVFIFIYLAGQLSQRVQYDLRKRLFAHLQGLSLSYYTKTPVGWIMSRATSDTERIAELVSWGLIDTTWAVMNITAALGFMFYINWQLSLIVVPLIPVLVYISIWFKERILVHYRESRRYNSEITGDYNEMITGVRIIKGLNREDTSMREFGSLTRGMYTSSYRAAWYSALFLPAIQIASSLVIGGIIFFGGLQVQNQVGIGLSIGELNAFIGYITFMLWPVQDMARVYASMQHAIASAERTFSLLDTEAEIVDKANTINVDTIAGDIVFENVDFYYNEDEIILKKFNLHIAQGETIALVGHTGSGKSTLVNLLCRFYEPSGGRILFGDNDYTDLTQNAIQSRIGMVLQTPHLFSGTIRDNIRYGRLDASDEEVEQAAQLSGAHDFISEFDKSYEEEVGEGGVLLSTGQKQLISLARAVLRKPELFIMDEATSSVDTITEYLIQKGMEHLMEGRTSVIIAHRLSTIKNADRIIVLDHGQIIEMGSHAELIKQKGHYYTLYTKQFRREAEVKLREDGREEPLTA